LKRIIIFILLFQFASYSQNADINLLRDVNLNRNHNLDNLFRGITNSVYVITPAVPLTLGGYGLFRKNSVAKRNALFISASLITVSAVSEILKYSIKRPRPFVTYPDIQNVTSATDPSFPSEHTSLAFSMATSVSLAYPKWYVIVPSFIWAGAVGYSRMDLGVHYPSDILCGAVLGAGSAYLCYIINLRLIHKKNY
jgi:membrane-associated phospholipid phosphatase